MRPSQVPRLLLQRVQVPPASPRTRARTSLLEMVVVPRTPALQAAEDALSLALVAMVVGTRPLVSTAMMRSHLSEIYGVTEELFSVHRYRPEDFIVRFSRPKDLEIVLGTLTPDDVPSPLCWRRWSRLSMASAGAFRFRVLVGKKGIPMHVRSKEMAETILWSSCTNTEITDNAALQDPDNEWELFVATWCAHPDLIPDEKIMVISEPEEPHDGGLPLYLRPHEIIRDEVPVLRYLVRLCLVNF